MDRHRIGEIGMNDLVEIEEKTVLVAFSSGEGLDPIINEVVDIVAAFKHDMSTPDKRAETKSLARRISSFKVRLDDLGKGLVSEWKTKSKAVDQSRKKMRDQLDELKITARKPLTEWEDEEQRRKNEEAAKYLAEKLRAEVESDHEMGLLLNEKIDREEAERRDRLEQERVAAERKLAEERAAREKELQKRAALQATIEAEEKAKKETQRIEKEKQEAIDREREAEEKAKQAEREKIAAQERAKAQAELAEKQRVEAKAKAKKDMEEAAERAKQEEIDRQAREEARIKAEEEKREANKRHVSKILKTAKEALISVADIDEKIAKKIVLAIKNNEIPSVSIRF